MLPSLTPPEDGGDGGDGGNGGDGGEANPRKRDRGGRPKGSTDEAKRERDQKITNATNEVAVQYGQHLDECKAKEKAENERRAPGTKEIRVNAKRGLFGELVVAARSKHGLSKEDFDPDQETIKRRHSRNPAKMAVVHRGTASPMAAVEPYLVQMIIQLCKINRTITKEELLLLANSLIKDTEHETTVVAFKTKHSHYSTGDVLLGEGWYTGFMSRNAATLQSSYGIKFSSQRADWCNYANALYMYDKVYEGLVESGVAVLMEKEVWLDREGNIVEEGSDEAFGPPRGTSSNDRTCSSFSTRLVAIPTSLTTTTMPARS